LIEQVVNLTFSLNTYILFSELYDHFWLVDCGDIKPVTEWINLHKKLLTGIFIKHTHFDHIYGLNQVVSLFPDCIVYTSEEGQKGLYSDIFNISHYNGESFIYKFDNIGILLNNDRIELFPNIFMNVIATPGHDWSCLTYPCNESLFTGDSFLPDYEAIS
jgi:hydroxyacylglutathione hydrolase